MNHILKGFGIFAMACFTDAYSMPDKQFYAAVNAGVFQADFSGNYLDKTDVIPQNMSGPALQNNYTGGIALGYNQKIKSDYFFGGEISAHINGGSAVYQSGASTSAFSDTLKLKNYFDFMFISGIVTHSIFSPYLKLGLSYADLSDDLVSPIGYTPIMTSFSMDKSILGFAAALGVSYSLNKRVALFSEINFHDYGTINFQDFQNFSADYTHSEQLTSYGLSIGAAYLFNT